ncbi:MAG: S9 family peptidase [Alphaproteobacteria bacterium]
MRDDNWRNVLRDPSLLRDDIKQHLNAENAYSAAIMAPAASLQEILFSEMKARIKPDDASAPSPDGVWDYYTRYAPGAEHAIHARRPRGRDDREEIMIDGDALAKIWSAAGHTFFKIGHTEHAPDHSLYAYAVDEQGSEVWSVRMRDLATGADLPDPIADCYGDFVFSPDSAYLFWIWRDDNGRPAKVFRRPARGGRADDVLIYEEEDDGFFLSVGVTESRRFILIVCGSHETNETRFIPALTPTATPIVFHPREEKVLYGLTDWQGRWHILTNADGATDFKVMRAEPGKTGRADWTPFIAHEPGRYIEGMAAYRDYLVRLERIEALPRIVVRAAAGDEHVIAQDEEAYALGVESGFEFDTVVTRYRYNSPTTPTRWIDYDMAARTKTVRKQQEIPSGHDPERYVTRRMFAKAPDGAMVPITALMLKSVKPDGAAPLLLYGYGAYGHSQEAAFSIRSLSLVDRGWIYAQAHTRGGADKGFGWFLDGRGANKANTFIDFIACAEHLIAEGYGRAGRIVAYGGSAGGMLMGAIANLRPDLWAGIIAAVPFVDVLNTMSDATLPLTPPEWPEWGNPLEDEAAYKTILAYSPYENITAKPYPAVLATSGLADPRVTYWEPSKWIARLRANTTSDRPIMLKMNMDSGHGGAAGRYDFLKEIALDYAFAIKAIGGQEAGGPF